LVLPLKGEIPGSGYLILRKKVKIDPFWYVVIGNACKYFLERDADYHAEIEQILFYHFLKKQRMIRALAYPANVNELLQQKTRPLN
jgi:hypothetical protein